MLQLHIGLSKLSEQLSCHEGISYFAIIRYSQPGNRFTISLFTASTYGKQAVAGTEYARYMHVYQWTKKWQ